MPSDATVHSYGSTFQIFDGVGVPAVGAVDAETTVNWNSIGCIHNITGPNVTITSTDTSCLTSTAATKTFIPGMIDSGDVTFTIDYTDDDEEYLAGLYRTLKYFRIQYPDGGRDVFYGFITAHSRNIPFDDRITMDLTIKVTGVIDVSAYDVNPADRP